MTGSLLFCICLAYFALAYFIYGGFLKRLFSIDPKRPTPAHTQIDGIDYVPTPAPVLFGHHFASIAGPGPIVGPIMAAYFGWLPALIWILVGCVFVGAFHDFAALVISVRNKGRSVSFVMEKLMGYSGRQLFLSFCLLCLVLVVAIFTLLIAGLFAKFPEVASASILFIILAPLFSLVTNKFGVSLKRASLVFIPLVFLSVYVGGEYPLNIASVFGIEEAILPKVWICFLAVYIFAASVMPVQWLLQPRDYMNSWLLYAMILLGFLSILFYNPSIEMNYFEGWSAVTGDKKMTALVPALFIFIACGACSGFHALVASGTTSKQLNNEKNALPIGYGSMLIEGVLGIMALVAVMSMSKGQFTELGRNPPAAFATGISQFSSALGLDPAYSKTFISLAISAFMMTSLDTATRLGRFICQELFMARASKDEVNTGVVKTHEMGIIRKCLINKFFTSFLIISVSILMALSGEASSLWPIFGASNQLMSALTLLVITLWLLSKNVNWLVAFIPMLFMMVMSIWGVIQVVQQQWNSNGVLVFIGCILVVMALLMVALGIAIISHHFKENFAKQEA
ncbi:MAG: carbon starvation protein A [Succinivibrio sp.]